MRKIAFVSLAALAAGVSTGTPARANCTVVGDSVGVGIGQALRGACASTARVGVSSSKGAAQARGGGWTVASVGSNDFPRGINAAQRVQSEARVRASLNALKARSGGRLIVVLPSNGARATVAAWASQNGVRTVSYAAGRDGIHPSNYASVAASVRGAMGQ